MNPVRVSLMWYVYLIINKNRDRWYTGCTPDLIKRIKEHNSGKNISTTHGVPWKLLYYEACYNKLDSYKREKYLKTSMGKHYLKNRLKFFLSNKTLTG